MGFGCVCLRNYWGRQCGIWQIPVSHNFGHVLSRRIYCLEGIHTTYPQESPLNPRLLFAFDLAWLQTRVQLSKLYKDLKVETLYHWQWNAQQILEHVIYIHVYVIEPFAIGLGFYKLFQLPTNMTMTMTMIQFPFGHRQHAYITVHHNRSDISDCIFLKISLLSRPLPEVARLVDVYKSQERWLMDLGEVHGNWWNSLCPYPYVSICV